MALAWSKWELKHLKRNYKSTPSRTRALPTCNPSLQNFFHNLPLRVIRLFLRSAKCLWHVVPQPRLLFPYCRLTSCLLQRITSRPSGQRGRQPHNRVNFQGNPVPHAGRALARSPSASSI